MNGKSKQVLFEVSTKVPVTRESEATAALSKALGITGTEEQEQETKTKIVMDHYTGNHSASSNWSIRQKNVRAHGRLRGIQGLRKGNRGRVTPYAGT